MDEIETDAAPESMDDFMGNAFDELEANEAPVEDEIAVEAKDDSEPVTDTSEDEPADKTEEYKPVEEQTIVAPQSMSAKDREKFYALPPEQQSWITDRVKQQESDYTKKTMELADQRKHYEKIDQILAPRRQQLAMDGMDDGAAVGQLFALSDFASKDPVGFTKYILNARGIPLTALTENGGGNYAPADPQLTALQNKIQGFENHFTQQAQAQQAQQINAVSSDIQTFAADPQYRFYNELEADMIPLVSAFRQSQPGLSNKEYLAKAYKAALSGNDEVAAKVSIDTEAKRVAEARKVADKAKKANGTSLRSRAVLPAGAAKAKNVDDFIGSLYDERAAG